MCRWLAYSGRPVSMDTLLFKPGNSLIRQSLSAQRGVVPTNGDGFGLGWYADLPAPGLFRDTMPAWNDANLHSLSQQIRSPLFFAHVRASTGTATTRLNCHPFRFENWLFMHNGKIGGYMQVRRDLEHLIPRAFYPFREGSTDSELFFYLMLSNGLQDDAPLAFAKTTAMILDVMSANHVEEPFRMTAACSDGKRVIALRYSSDNRSPSLFWGHGCDVWVEDGEVHFSEGQGCVLVLSEPLDEVGGSWHEIGESEILIARGGDVQVRAFDPRGGTRKASPAGANDDAHRYLGA
ncbi:MAG: class II glutamine amidotransferase [Alphaproteobacteria bacterium]|nr:class II glutamine amidotransferase [Alphaproteobacteria bacterium]